MTDPGVDDRSVSHLTVVHVAKDPMEAQMIASMLEAAGVKSYVEGTMLNDEFATSQRLANNIGVRVQIRRDQVARARVVLAGYESSASEIDPDSLAEEALLASDPEEFEPTGSDEPSLAGLRGRSVQGVRIYVVLVLLALALMLAFGLGEVFGSAF